MLRQVHPVLFVDGRPTSALFKPRPADKGLVSVHQEALVTAQDAHAAHTAAGLGSIGVVGVLVSECDDPRVALQVLEAPLSVTDDPPEVRDDPAHAVIDFRGLSGNACEKKSRELSRICWSRGFCYQPPTT